MLKQTQNGQNLMNKFMNLEKINSLIEVDTNSGQTHVVVTQSEAAGKGLDGIRSKIRDVLISCLEKYGPFSCHENSQCLLVKWMLFINSGSDSLSSNIKWG